MSWGKGITLSLIAFVAMISILVYMSTKQNFSLVTDRYYEKSLDYDKVQTMKSNYSLLNQEATVQINPKEQKLDFLLPEGFEGRDIKGSVHLYNPVDSDHDQLFELRQPFSISTSKLKKGKWNVIVNWKDDGKGYLFERTIFIN